MSFIAPKKEEILKTIGDELVAEIRKNMADAGINASGNLSDSLEAVVVEDGLEIWGDYYFEYAQKGRGPGKIPYGFADILKKWIEDKHLTIPDKFSTAKDFGWAIARKIAEFGSKRYREGTSLDLISDAADRAADKIADRLGVTIWETIFE